jgi:hypothetical protein
LLLFYAVPDDYRAHTSCVTEVERYEKRTPKKNGKVPPQQLWMELIVDSIPIAPTHLQSYIRTMSTLDNVPRKEKPFYNFTANSLNLKHKHGSAIVSEIWKFLSDCRQNPVSNNKQSKDLGESSQEQRNNNLPISVTDNHALYVQPQLDSEEKVALNSNEGMKTTKIESVTGKVDKKIVKKTMKQAFKNANSKSLTMKQLRKLVKEHFSKDEQNSVKQIIKETIGRGKYFSREGEIITILN